MEMLKLFNVVPLEKCCMQTLTKLIVDGITVCENIRNYFAQ